MRRCLDCSSVIRLTHTVRGLLRTVFCLGHPQPHLLGLVTLRSPIPMASGARSTWEGGGGVVRGFYRQGNLATVWRSQSSNCLTHALTCRSMLHAEPERLANHTATESSISSQHLKESAVLQNCLKPMEPQNAVPLASSLPCPPTSLNFARGNFQHLP